MANAKRWCYYTNESFAKRVDGKIVYHLAVVTEGERGYEVGHTSDSLDTLKGMADLSNTNMGLTRDDVLDIVASSMGVVNMRRVPKLSEMPRNPNVSSL